MPLLADAHAARCRRLQDIYGLDVCLGTRRNYIYKLLSMHSACPRECAAWHMLCLLLSGVCMAAWRCACAAVPDGWTGLSRPAIVAQHGMWRVPFVACCGLASARATALFASDCFCLSHKLVFGCERFWRERNLRLGRKTTVGAGGGEDTHGRRGPTALVPASSRASRQACFK